MFQGVGLLRLLFVFGWLWALLMMALAMIFSIASGDWLNILSSIVLGTSSVRTLARVLESQDASCGILS